jgi:integrase
MPLSEVRLRGLKPTGKPFKIADGGGLRLMVSAIGSKYWKLAYRRRGKQTEITLGQYPKMSLADARLARENAKDLLDRGGDPAGAKLVGVIAREGGATFKAVAEEWYGRNAARWRTSYSGRMWARMERDVFPQIGDREIGEIEPLEVLAAVRLVEKRGANDIARRMLRNISAVFRYGIAAGYCKGDPTVGLRDALGTPRQVQHRAAISASEVPQLLRAIDAYQGDPLTVLGLRMVLLTAVRTNELRFARWEEIEGDLWRVPAERMKMSRPHLVPIVPQAAALLTELRRFERDGWMFPANTMSGVISENTLLYALYRMGWHKRATVHGFRTLFSTVLNEEGFNRDWIEMQLAHVEGSVRGAYNAAEYLNGRREMMTWWADWLDAQITN